jgi:hypothetical protein
MEKERADGAARMRAGRDHGVPSPAGGQDPCCVRPDRPPASIETGRTFPVNEYTKPALSTSIRKTEL